MATLQLNAIERKSLVKQAECLYKQSHCMNNYIKLIYYIKACYYIVVNFDETTKLLFKHRTLTGGKIDRVTFCDLLHDWFGMTDDYFMDKGLQSSNIHYLNLYNYCHIPSLQYSRHLIKILMEY